MAKQPNQKAKLLVLQEILRRETDEEHPLTLKQIQGMLEARGISAERKSLYDDMEQLRLLGEDIVSVRNKSTAYYVGQRLFDLPQLRLLVDAVQSSRFITKRKSEELVHSLEALTSRHQAGKLRRQVLVSDRIKNMNESIYYTVDSLQEALASNRQVEFRYFDWGPDKRQHLRRDGAAYRVSPWALTWDNENYYLIAFEEASDAIRHYRVDRMLRIRVTDAPRTGEERYRREEGTNRAAKTFQMFSGREETVTLLCRETMAGVMLDRFGRDVTFYPQPDGRFSIHVPVMVSPQFFGWLTGLHGGAAIASPASVAEEYRVFLEDILKGYDGAL